MIIVVVLYQLVNLAEIRPWEGLGKCLSGLLSGHKMKPKKSFYSCESLWSITDFLQGEWYVVFMCSLCSCASWLMLYLRTTWVNQSEVKTTSKLFASGSPWQLERHETSLHSSLSSLSNTKHKSDQVFHSHRFLVIFISIQTMAGLEVRVKHYVSQEQKRR